MKPVVRPELRYRRLWFACGVALAVLISIVCWVPMRELPKIESVSDKLEHFVAFGLLAFWFGSIVVRRDLAWLAIALVGFGGLIELGQAAMRLGRQAEFLDLVADAIGVLLGLLLALTPLGRWAFWLETRIARARQ